MIDRAAAAAERERKERARVHPLPPLSDAQIARVAALLTLGPLARTEADR